ncbi:hypothetical protein HC026_07550 [Lactobacillus sp. LC28-10]|uniref:Uncharacterized protein n=1 Tax=Secundilactobacillus angelensis TaxID=2722706 RepID=A0ABX1L039_9LACO|nr:hypothetical protein [Secundilactobacillus angelensis]MCH5462842.1 hypothetical protein [Secundilactobacillus angelensis]NLR18780.1 hypothetical protein [Secundilactobacillus angelensis]
MTQLDEQLDNWLDQVGEVPLVNNLSQADQERILLIDSVVLQVAIEGYGKQPNEWTTEMLTDLFFNRFVRLLDKDEKQQRLFDLIPMAVMVLLRVMQPRSFSELTNWVNENHNQLTHLYDPIAGKVYARLDHAMKLANLNMKDPSKVASFTREYLRKHPMESKTLFEKRNPHEK